MRAIIIGTTMLLGSIALVAAAPDKSAKTRPSKEAQAVMVSTPTGAQPAEGVRRLDAVALTSAECVKLGGEVIRNDDISGACTSHSYCRTFDGNGEAHRVCLSAN